jgi:hypothetical protein
MVRGLSTIVCEVSGLCFFKDSMAANVPEDGADKLGE